MTDQWRQIIKKRKEIILNTLAVAIVINLNTVKVLKNNNLKLNLSGFSR